MPPPTPPPTPPPSPPTPPPSPPTPPPSPTPPTPPPTPPPSPTPPPTPPPSPTPPPTPPPSPTPPPTPPPSPTPPPTPPPSPTPPPTPPPSPTPPPTPPPSPTPPPTPPPSPTPPPTPPPPPYYPEFPTTADTFVPSEDSQGTGYAFLLSREKNASITMEYEDIYANTISNNLDFAQGLSDIIYDVSLYTTGASINELGNFVTGLAINQNSLNYTFTQEQNLEAFGTGSGAQRYYQLLFDVKNNNLQNDVVATVYHLPSNISYVEKFDYTTDSGTINLINFNLIFNENYEYFIPRKVDIYTGENSGNFYDLSGFSLLKTDTFLTDSNTQVITIQQNEVPVNQYIYYKFLPYDDFGSGLVYGSIVSGYLYSPPEALYFSNGVPPVLSSQQRTGQLFSGLITPSGVPSVDGSLIFETGSGSQNLYLLKSGQWKTVKPFEETSGLYSRFVQTPLSATGSGSIGDFSISGQYLYAVTGVNQWGRAPLSFWYGPIGSFSWSGTGISGTGQISWTSADQATGYIVYRSEYSITGTYSQVFSGTGFYYNDPVPSPDNNYYYNVAAFNNEYISSGTAATVYVPS